jgi:hypothetical protein
MRGTRIFIVVSVYETRRSYMTVMTTFSVVFLGVKNAGVIKETNLFTTTVT